MAHRRLSFGSSLEYDAEVAFVSQLTAASGQRASITSEEFEFSLRGYQLRSALPGKEGEEVERGGGGGGGGRIGGGGGGKGQEGLDLGAEVTERGEIDKSRRSESAGNQASDDKTATGGRGTEETDGGSEFTDGQPSTVTAENSKEEAKEDTTLVGPGQKLLVIYGPSPHSRTHLAQKLVHSSPSIFTLVIAHTSRKRQPDEINGVDFHFVSKKEIMAQIDRGGFIEYTRAPKPVKAQKKRADTIVDVNMTVTSDESIPVKGGTVTGTSRHALQEALLQGKPCVVLNVSMLGAHQLMAAGVDGVYILLHSGEKFKLSGSRSGFSNTPHYTVSTDNLERGYSKLRRIAFDQLGLSTTLSLQPTAPTYQTAIEEWETIPTVEMEKDRAPGFPVKPSRIVSFSEVLAHYQTATIGQKSKAVKSEQHHTSTSFFSRHKLAKKLHNERNLIFTISACQFNNQEPLHLLTLQTIYRKLTGNAMSCRRFGSHWTEIGFHGIDPADDLRGVGFLGVTQLLNLVDGPRTLEFAREVYQFSCDKAHSAPFCVLSLNLTQIVLSALRNDTLSKICNKRDQVFVVANELHAALLYQYYQKWRSGEKSPHKLGVLVQEIEGYVKGHVKQVLSDWEDYLEEAGGKRATWDLGTSPVDVHEEFTPLEQYTHT